MKIYKITKTFIAGILFGITVSDTISFDGACRFRVGQEVEAIGGGTYRVDAIELVS